VDSRRAAGAYLNFLLRKPDGENGSAILSEKPALSPVVKQAAARRKQLLPFFTEGLPIGDCILAERSPLFVRSHLHNNRALIVVLNDGNGPRTLDINLNLPLWLTGDAHSVSRYDANGRLTSETRISVKKGQPFRLKGSELNPGEMEFIVING
jgi:hypothetical protein